MDKRVVLLIAAASAAGGYVAAEYPALTAKAGMVETKSYVFSGTANAAVQAEIQEADGVGGRAVARRSASPRRLSAPCPRPMSTGPLAILGNVRSVGNTRQRACPAPLSGASRSR
jgi:hypothetical protein